MISSRILTILILSALYILPLREILAADNTDVDDPEQESEQHDDDSATTPPEDGFVEVHNRAFREDMAVAGTPYGLHYTSWRSPDNIAAYLLNIPLFDEVNPRDYESITVTLEVAGRSFTTKYDKPLAQPFHTFLWDGKDDQEEILKGVHPVRIVKVFVEAIQQPSVPQKTTMSANSGGGGGAEGGGEPPKLPLSGSGSGGVSDGDFSPQPSGKLNSPNSGGGGGFSEVQTTVGDIIFETVPKVFTRTKNTHLGVDLATNQGLGGWTITPHHHYDITGKTLFMGNGSVRQADPVGTPACVFQVLGEEEPNETNLISVVSASGAELYVFNGSGRHLLTLDSHTSITNFIFGYDEDDLLITITDRYGNITEVERDDQGKPTAIIGPYGQRTELSLNASGYLEEMVNPAMETNAFWYTEGGLLTNVVTRRANTYKIEYDPTGRVTRLTAPDGLTKEFSRKDKYASYQIEYVRGGTQTNLYTVEYLEGGLVKRTSTGPDCCTVNTETTSKDKAESTRVLSDGTTIISESEPDSRFDYQIPRVKEQIIQMPSGLNMTVAAEHTISLQDTNDLLSVLSMTNQIAINGRISQTTYTATNRQIQRMSPEGRSYTITFDEKGSPVEIDVPGLHPFRISTAENGRVIEHAQGTGADERRIQYHYNANGFLEFITNALGHEVQLFQDQIGRATNVIRADNEAVSARYDRSSQVTGITPPGKPEHSFAYNEVNHPTQYSAPEVEGQADITYAWNVYRELTKVTFPDHRSITNVYSPDGKLLESKWPENAITYEYDESSRRVINMSATNGASLQFSWNGSLLTGISVGNIITGTVSFSYNNDFQVSASGFNGQQVAYSYDRDGLLTNAGELALGRSPHSGFLTNMNLAGSVDELQYNLFGEMSAYQSSYLTTNLLEFDFQYDALGRITSRVESIQGDAILWAYTYDLAGRLHEVYTNGYLRSRYQYDGNGNRTNAQVGADLRAAQYDAQDRLLTNGPVRYQYNAHGTLTNRISGSTTNVYVYDTRGSLLEVREGTNVIQYAVDPMGRRIARMKNGVLTQRLIYQDFLKPIAELNADGTTASRFVYATRANVPDYMVRTGIIYRIITDHLGSVRLVVNTETGEIVQRMDYDEWGRVQLDTNPGFQPFGFAGGLFDPDTGLVRFGYRDYDPEIGRWRAKDPILFNGGQLNLYSYSHNNPINRLDIYGLSSDTYESAQSRFGSLLDDTIFVISFQGQCVPIMGAEFALNMSVDQNGLTISISVGAAVGFDVGIAAVGGLFNGNDSRDFLGEYSNFSGSGGIFSGDIAWTPNGFGGILIGAGLGLGVGVHYTIRGETYCISDHHP